jgi:uncharacterized protein
MKQQIICIHGGNPFQNYAAYINYLKKCKLDRKKLLGKKDWKNNLRNDLDKNYEVLTPMMPCKQNAKYSEWKLWFKKCVPFLKNNVILIGHSLGGIFLIKYLSENKLPVKISAAHIVAAPFSEKIQGRTFADFKLPKSLKGFISQSLEIYLYHSRDDRVVPYKSVLEYKKLLPNAKVITLKKRDHVMQSKFPELIRNIKS